MAHFHLLHITHISPSSPSHTSQPSHTMHTSPNSPSHAHHIPLPVHFTHHTHLSQTPSSPSHTPLLAYLYTPTHPSWLTSTHPHTSPGLPSLSMARIQLDTTRGISLPVAFRYSTTLPPNSRGTSPGTLWPDESTPTGTGGLWGKIHRSFTSLPGTVVAVCAYTIVHYHYSLLSHTLSKMSVDTETKSEHTHSNSHFLLIKSFLKGIKLGMGKG